VPFEEVKSPEKRDELALTLDPEQAATIEHSAEKPDGLLLITK
jgi:hypothetical protein